MVQKRFWQDPYQVELDTHIDQINGDQVTVAETILFVFSGGQESDRGMIDNRVVVNAEKQGSQIYYTLDSAAGLKPGDAVSMTVDWPRRYQLMRLHFAAEIILELIYQSHPGTEKTGAHIGEDKARIDFMWDGNISDLFADLIDKFDHIRKSNLPILCDFSDAASERRFWKVDGFAEVPCGGTHVRSTGEVGPILLKRKNPGKGKERIEIFLQDIISP